MQIDLREKKILLTGSNGGIGSAIAAELVKSGAMVALHYYQNKNRLEKLQAEFGDRVVLVQGDLSNQEQTINVFHTSFNALEGLNVLINNAGIALHSPLSSPKNSWLLDWENTLQVNLVAAALLCKEAVHCFKQHAGGAIINISSRAAFRGDTSEFWAYAASKGGMVSLTRSIARGFGKSGIVAFNIAPGFVKTEMAQEFIQRYGEQVVMDDLALNRLTTAADIAPMVALLASGLADHATGTTIDINAGSYIH